MSAYTLLKSLMHSSAGKQSSLLWQSLRFEWLWIYHAPAPVTEMWSKDIVTPSGWFWVARGEVHIHADGHLHVIPQGHSFFSAPGTRRQWMSKDCRLLSVGFRCQWPDGEPLLQQGLNCKLNAERSLSLIRATRLLYRQVHGSSKGIDYRTAILPGSIDLKTWAKREAAYRQWFTVFLDTLQAHKLPARSRASGDRMTALLQGLQAWPLAQTLKLPALAEQAQLTPRRVHDLLKERLRVTPTNWHESRRVQAAKLALATTDQSFKHVSMDLGFRYPAHFTKWFKRHARLTPTDFRRQATSGL
jgi:AraC-like DNA-binding protein